ncbi:MAG: DUF2062 domain-containing protein [Cocleimonas sp.]|nr:DUF2062 domain-containing protein [Cocleimonas sp.]
MPRRFLKKYSPSPKTIRENKALSLLGESIHQPNLWCMNRHSVSKAFAIGLFCTWIPLPLQTLMAAFLAIYYRANLPLSVTLVFITNPFTIPPMFYFAYKLGGLMLGIEPQDVPMDLSLEWITTTLGYIWQPLLFGCLILAVISSVTGYFFINSLWRKSTKKRWQDRKEKRAAKKAKRAMKKKIKKEMLKTSKNATSSEN